jgi:flagellar biosynthesis protein FliQ
MDTFTVSIAKEGLFLVLILSAPPVISALMIGLFVSILQATTQVQEQTLTFVPKLVTILLVIAFLGPLGFVELVSFTRYIFENFSAYVK